ncbi:hypothetical protein TVAG_183800 [Trichomonas vaginalis G3]|uniref:Uncharacterized protein n=1 Tax=Trichomonas vaginalis (strain ATCC PRA-98 / G3) TaxID=412133 RepID=A2D9B7_TRIV3|nr:hypothetical protein TVAGG3_0770390 [Trichomonas vaginalis G3]EAY23143.1 hypothetical protein TVAG_183800 [Trichomonas vaginalis G3]KAI5513790.1 hypothetical protein TVAGG3_0770390 [Trichomonas vaginalis G3]|eukprot:XP_001584129.1 hypothetical protein [Trichomonas vaginalis G3]
MKKNPKKPLKQKSFSLLTSQLTKVGYNVFDITDFKNALNQKGDIILLRAIWIQFTKNIVRKTNVSIAKGIHQLNNNVLALTKENKRRYFDKWKSKTSIFAEDENSENLFIFDDTESSSSDNLPDLPKLNQEKLNEAANKLQNSAKRKSPVKTRSLKHDSSPKAEKIQQNLPVEQKKPTKKLKRIKRKPVSPQITLPTSTEIWQQYCKRVLLNNTINLCKKYQRNLIAYDDWLFMCRSMKNLRYIQVQKLFEARRKWNALVKSAQRHNLRKVYSEELKINKVTDISDHIRLDKYFNKWKSQIPEEYEYESSETPIAVIPQKENKSSQNSPRPIDQKRIGNTPLSEVEDIHTSSLEIIQNAKIVEEEEDKEYYEEEDEIFVAKRDVDLDMTEDQQNFNFDFTNYETELSIILWNISSEMYPSHFPEVGEYFSLKPELRSDYVKPEKEQPQIIEKSPEKEYSYSSDDENEKLDFEIPESPKEGKHSDSDSIHLESLSDPFPAEQPENIEKKEKVSESSEKPQKMIPIDVKPEDTSDSSSYSSSGVIETSDNIPIPISVQENEKEQQNEEEYSKEEDSPVPAQTENFNELIKEIDSQINENIKDICNNSVKIDVEGVLSFLDDKLNQIAITQSEKAEQEAQQIKPQSGASPASDIESFFNISFSGLISSVIAASTTLAFNVIDTTRVRKTKIHKKNKKEDITFDEEASNLVDDAFQFAVHNAFTLSMPDL